MTYDLDLLKGAKITLEGDVGGRDCDKPLQIFRFETEQPIALQWEKEIRSKEIFFVGTYIYAPNEMDFSVEVTKFGLGRKTAALNKGIRWQSTFKENARDAIRDRITEYF